ncbi:hypothetical protein T10_13630 [Trichinella papuae]|uniref:Uncharacterized protein n=1 Tax=Trichinella papuae TaxID=268474 RepID=A0A0V1MP20_9BILA|nr:hypothetical protein T10_13630 [Trichinella papuae]
MKKMSIVSEKFYNLTLFVCFKRMLQQLQRTAALLQEELDENTSLTMKMQSVKRNVTCVKTAFKEFFK